MAIIFSTTIDDDYWTALEILADETGNIRECMAQKLQWFPADGDRFEWAMRTYHNWHSGDVETYLLTFPWPEPGVVPEIPGRYFVPTDAERAKMQWFVDNFDGDDEELWVKDLVELARVVFEEIN